jgi:hypothetical protein
MDDEAVGGVRRRVKQPAQSMASITKQVPPAGTTTHTDPLVKHGRRQGSCGLHARLGEHSRAVSEAEHPIHRRNNRNEKDGKVISLWLCWVKARAPLITTLPSCLQLSTHIYGSTPNNLLSQGLDGVAPRLLCWLLWLGFQ